MRPVDAAEARAHIAAHVLGSPGITQLGQIALQPHQVNAAARLYDMLQEHGGALLADDVGLGKTFTALGVASRFRDVIVVAPAVVRAHWLESARRSDSRIAFHSMERLSRRGAPVRSATLVIVDEAHHFRSPRTRRFAALCRLCLHARVLLLSATPIQNRDRDLRTLLSLFLGSRADALTDADLTRYVVRRVVADVVSDRVRLPDVRAPKWLPHIDDVDCLDRLLALPEPISPVDAGDGGALVTFTLVRQWASSRAALASALRRRLARGLAMLDALAAGRIPSRAELAAWCHVDDAQQLAFPELVARSAGPIVARLRSHMDRHVRALRELVAWLGAAPDPDSQRARVLLTLLERHAGDRIVAFSEYADTVSALFESLRGKAHAAMLTHRGGRIASGPVSRAEILDRFGVGAGARLHRRDRVDVLLSTDVLSEGISLPDAGVVVHLDLAWNPARLEQRVGRLRRLDSQRDSIAVYLMPPPAPAERLLRVEQRLRQKRAIAERVLGVSTAFLPGGQNVCAPAAAASRERLARVLQSWTRPLRHRGEHVVAAATASHRGAIACVRLDGHLTLLAVSDERVTDDITAVEQLCTRAAGSSATVEPGALTETRGRIERFLGARRVSQVVDASAMHVARTRRVLIRRAERIARAASREHRARIAPTLVAARVLASVTLSSGAERQLEELAHVEAPDDAWLRSVREFASRNVAPRSAPEADILVLLLLRPD